MSTSNRIEWIDLCKALAICLVLLGHTLKNSISEVYIYGFHMPLFFLLSGLVLSDKDRPFKIFIKKRFNSLILPFIFFYLLTYFYWLAFERNFRSFDIEWWRPLLGLFYAANWKDLMIHNGILWFLPCLFMVELEYQLIKRMGGGNVQLISVLALAIIGYHIKTVLPWCLNISFVVLQFYYVGVILRPILIKSKSIFEDGHKNTWFYLGAMIISALIYMYLQYKYQVKVNLVSNSVTNVGLFQVISYLGIFSMIAFCKIWNPKLSKKMWLFIGSNTLVIFALHQPILRIVRFISAKYIHTFSPDVFTTHALLADALILLILWPIIIFYNKYKDKIYSVFNVSFNYKKSKYQK